jgi:hypothetical protein
MLYVDTVYIHILKIYPKLVCIKVEKLKQCLEDITSVCILEGFQKQEHLVLVRVFYIFFEIGTISCANYAPIFEERCYGYR